MTDREKVIEGLKRLLHSGRMYDAHLVTDTCEAAIALLKAQEPVEPSVGGSADNCWWHTCGICGEAIDYHDRYCRHCGKAAKWDG